MLTNVYMQMQYFPLVRTYKELLMPSKCLNHTNYPVHFHTFQLCFGNTSQIPFSATIKIR